MPARTTDLTDARVVLTGATGGLGSRIAALLLAEGADVIGLSRSAERLAGIEGVQGVVADLRDPAAAKSVSDALAGQAIDVLIHAAGVVAFGPVAEVEDHVLEELFATNVTGPLRLTRELLPHMADGGVIAAITGVVATQPMAGLASYAASKSALSSALTALRRELRRSGVDVVELQPPHTETGLADRPLSGTAPAMPAGADADAVATRIVAAITSRERVVEASDFS